MCGCKSSYKQPKKGIRQPIRSGTKHNVQHIANPKHIIFTKTKKITEKHINANV